ncbi:MAG TPA: RNA polymerase factor sigma-54 [candidate division Zixibacteria bacterium]
MKLELRPGLRQVLAPQLIQSLKMLQMPALKLEQTLRQELAINPLLEEVEVESDDSDSADDAPESESSSEEDSFDWESYLEEDSEFVPRRMRETREELPERTPVVERTLYDHLIEQLQLTKLPQDELEIGEYLIGNINEDGILPMTTEDLAADLKAPLEKVAKVLKLVQTFDPPGVGARDLKESILIQMQQRGESDSLAARIVAEHWRELDRKTHMQLAQSLGVSVERIHEAMNHLKTLSPRPAQGRFTVGARAVIPDMVVEKIDDEYVVYHNDKYVPSLRINDAYKSLLRRGQNVPAETKTYIREKLEQARWLLNALTQRRSTMVRVMEAIVEEQREFFEKGPASLKPLIMENIASKLGINVATVSRVASDKYVQTPQGVREIKSFFNSGVERTDGESMTKSTVKQRIAAMIDKEDPSHPLSDQEIHRLLLKEGIKLARRTVTKYREELHIQSARFRKTVFDKKQPAVSAGPVDGVSDPESADDGDTQEGRREVETVVPVSQNHSLIDWGISPGR